MIEGINEEVNVKLVELEGELYIALYSGAFGATMSIEVCKKLGQALTEIADEAMNMAIEKGLCVTN